MDLSPYWFKPEFQPWDTPVELQLRPADMRTLYQLQTGVDFEKERLSWEGVAAAFEYCVIGWKGIAPDYSAVEKRKVLNGAADQHWLIWLSEVATECYRRAVMGEAEKKTS